MATPNYFESDTMDKHMVNENILCQPKSKNSLEVRLKTKVFRFYFYYKKLKVIFLL